MTPKPGTPPPGDDEWADWLLRHRYGSGGEIARSVQEALLTWRDRVLRNARIKAGDVVLDVGTGDGLVGLGALGLVGDGGRVVFSDVSPRLLERCRESVTAAGLMSRADFRLVAAERLSGIADGSVDVVTTRSVLMHVDDRESAFAEFHRVLRPGGRISCFESVAALTGEDDDRFRGYDIRPVRPLFDRMRGALDGQGLGPTPAMMSFDDRDLVRLAHAAGFSRVHLTLEVELAEPSPMRNWEFLYETPVHPSLPTLQEAASASLSASEIGELIAYLRPLVESGVGRRSQAIAYLVGWRGQEKRGGPSAAPGPVPRG